jgi:hypothetical protein
VGRWAGMGIGICTMLAYIGISIGFIITALFQKKMKPSLNNYNFHISKFIQLTHVLVEQHEAISQTFLLNKLAG